MTYTFKLARRLAILREFAVIAVLALLVACVQDFTAPEAGSTGSRTNSATLQVLPRSVTVETGQRVQFRGQAGTLNGLAMPTPVAWVASGGTISADGMFSSSTTGTFKVIGRGQGWKQADTSVVKVVAPSSNLARIAVTPGNASLEPGATRTFTATGYLSDGSTAPVGVVWSATGGNVDPSGVYIAGPATGSYRVIATNTSGTLADTASITISEPAPALTSVVVSPASVSLATGGSKQFKAYGRNSAGDSVAVTVSFSATGGAITSSGLYTAGSTGGTYRVVAVASGISDTAIVTLTQPTATGGAVGLPFGPYMFLDAHVPTAPLSLSSDANQPSTIVAYIDAARQQHVRVMLAMTGGSHNNYLTNGVFDPAKWGARLATFNTSAIRDAIARGVADGTILGATVMDEPNVSGAGDGNTWGPVGTMTKARVDSLCAVVQSYFPTLAAGVEHKHNTFEPDKSYRVCQFIVDQYGARLGSVTAFRDGGLALGARDHHAILFSLNVLNGGVQDKDGTWDCTGPDQGGKGTYAPNCRMTADQVREWGLILGPAGCGLFMWRYDDAFMADAANQRAFKEVAAGMATAPWKSCRRP